MMNALLVGHFKLAKVRRYQIKLVQQNMKLVLLEIRVKLANAGMH